MSGPSKNVTSDFVVEDAPVAAPQEPRETDPHRIQQRQKQIDLGKNTLGYQRYRQQVPRDRRGRQQPQTPDVHQVCSKRSFDGQIRKWRRQLHEWDPAAEGEQEQQENADSANPAPPESERSWEHITHADCAEQPDQRPRSAPKNGGALRPANAGLPQRGTLTSQANRKRNFSESTMTCQPLSPSSAAVLQPAVAKLAKTAAGTAAAEPAAAAAALAPPTTQETGDEAVDYGEEEDWAWVDEAEAEADETNIYNNWGALSDDGLEEVAV